MNRVFTFLKSTTSDDGCVVALPKYNKTSPNSWHTLLLLVNRTYLHSQCWRQESTHVRTERVGLDLITFPYLMFTRSNVCSCNSPTLTLNIIKNDKIADFAFVNIVYSKESSFKRKAERGMELCDINDPSILKNTVPGNSHVIQFTIV